MMITLHTKSRIGFALAILLPTFNAFTPTVQLRTTTQKSFLHRPSRQVFANTRLHATVQGKSSDAFITESFRPTACDDINTPPSLSILLRSIIALQSGSDIRGQYVEHSNVGSIANVAHAIASRRAGSPAALTPFAGRCYGRAFATIVKQFSGQDQVVICIGRDPREHGIRLCDAVARGAESVEGVKVIYTGLATTPSMFEFCRANKCDGAVMVTASHLPADRNGFKFFTKRTGGFTKRDIGYLTELAMDYARELHDVGIIPPSSGYGAVFCSEWVDFMPHYASTLRDALIREVTLGLPDGKRSDIPLPLAGLRIVLNTGNGSGGFFHQILHDLGADVSSSLNLEPDPDFPNGIPNPEYSDMITATTKACEECNADIGIMLDTDADRCGFVVPRTVTPNHSADYEPLNRNRLIALLSVIFSGSAPCCTIVTDSVTSEGLAKFIEDDLGLKHYRYLKGYANVIGKARELTESGQANAEMAIETSGHCAMKENGYLDDGTYTAVKVIGLLARVARSRHEEGGHLSLLDLISDMKEMAEVKELRMNVLDGTLETTSAIFDHAALMIERGSEWPCEVGHMGKWKLDRENLEGVRVRTGKGGFFMLRKSLHDPLISLQVESTSMDDARENVVKPLLAMFSAEDQIRAGLDLSVLEKY